MSEYRKSPLELVEAIMGALEVKSDMTIQSISKATGSHWGTIQKYMQLITVVQAAPQVLVSKSPLGRGHVYRRERAPYTKRAVDG